MLPLGDVQLNYMETTDDAFAFKRWLSEDRNREILGFDLESRGLRHWRPQFRITLAQFGDVDAGWSFQPKQLGTLLYDVFRDYKGKIGGHNLGGFDLHALLAEEYPLPDRRRMYDSLPMSKLARANSYMHSLDSLINEYIGATSEASFAKHILDDAFEAHGFNKKTTNQELAERAWTEVARAGGAAFRVYSTMDVVSFCRIYAQLWKQVQDLGMEAAYWKEMGSWETTFVAEHKGIRVDLDYCAQYDEELTQEIKIVRTQLNELGVPEPSKRQKIAAKWLEEGWVPKEWNKKSGKPKLDKRVLEGLDHEAVGPLLEWSRLNHWQNNYIRSAMNLAVDGRVHPSINIMEAKTHRESARTPPFHQLPSRHPDAWKVRRMVLPEEGEKMCSIDYNAQELRITKHLTQDPVLTKIFDDGLDVHTVTGSLLFETRYENVTKAQRDFAKGWAYACLTPEHRVLTRDLTWVPVGSLSPGDPIYAFDEDQQPGSHARQKQRRWRQGFVTHTGRDVKHVLRITLEDGTIFTCTPDHPWLMSSYRLKNKGKSMWRTAGVLEVGDFLLRATDVWDVETSWEAGWMSGILDGEGSCNLSRGNSDAGQVGMSVAQVPGLVHDQIEQLLTKFGASWGYSPPRVGSSAASWTINGRMRDRLRLLGKLQPLRLLNNAWNTMDGFTFETQRVRIVSIEDAGMAEIVTLGTSTATFIAEGFATHNSGYGAQDPRLAAMLGVSVGEVAAFRQRVNGGFVGIAAYNEEIIRQVEHMYADTGEAYITASDGRRCYIDVKFGRLQSHQALNYPKQMEGGIILKESKNRVAAAGLAEHLVLAIHDEHLISVPPGKDGEEIKHEYASAMALVDGEYSIDMSTSAGDLTDYWSGH